MISKRESATNIYGSATSFPIPLSSISTPRNSKTASKPHIFSILQKPISGLLQKNDSLFSTKLLHNISLHLKNIYEAGELQAEATSEKISVVQTEGSRQVNRATLFYNLEPPHLVVGNAALVGDFSSILHRCVHLVDDLLGLGGT